MNSLDAIGSISAGAAPVEPTLISGAIGQSQAGEIIPSNLASFARLMTSGISDMQDKIRYANELVNAYALDESIPAHSVMIALEEARISVELGLQVRNRLVDAYRDIMNMQL